jgi:hypothetical protein
VNLLERTAINLAWKRLGGNVKGLDRWVPFICTVVAVLTVLLRQLGHPGAADGLEALVRVVGFDLSADQILATAAVGSTYGLVRQGYSRFQKARAGA